MIKGMKKTLVISAFPGCGKTTYFKHENSALVLDSDSSEFSWEKDVFGTNTSVRHPDFPNNYLNYIASNLGKVEIIFVSSHKSVREGLRLRGIFYYLIYPAKSLRLDWKSRFEHRGNSVEFISFIIDNWDSLIEDMSNESFPFKYCLSGGLNSYIDSRLISYLRSQV
jgi:hypothetical protein